MSNRPKSAKLRTRSDSEAAPTTSRTGKTDTQDDTDGTRRGRARPKSAHHNRMKRPPVFTAGSWEEDSSSDGGIEIIEDDCSRSTNTNDSTADVSSTSTSGTDGCGSGSREVSCEEVLELDIQSSSKCGGDTYRGNKSRMDLHLGHGSEQSWAQSRNRPRAHRRRRFLSDTDTRLMTSADVDSSGDEHVSNAEDNASRDCPSRTRAHSYSNSEQDNTTPTGSGQQNGWERNIVEARKRVLNRYSKNSSSSEQDHTAELKPVAPRKLQSLGAPTPNLDEDVDINQIVGLSDSSGSSCGSPILELADGSELRVHSTSGAVWVKPQLEENINPVFTAPQHVQRNKLDKLNKHPQVKTSKKLSPRSRKVQTRLENVREDSIISTPTILTPRGEAGSQMNTARSTDAFKPLNLTREQTNVQTPSNKHMEPCSPRKLYQKDASLVQISHQLKTMET